MREPKTVLQLCHWDSGSVTFVSWTNRSTLSHRMAVKTLGPRPNGRHFADDIFKCILLNGNAWFSIKISLRYVPCGPTDNKRALVQIVAWY